jgi:hypothetical protein
VITNDVSDYINLLVRIAHIICNLSILFKNPLFNEYFLYLASRRKTSYLVANASSQTFTYSASLLLYSPQCHVLRKTAFI